jgi:hypothetical protein
MGGGSRGADPFEKIPHIFCKQPQKPASFFLIPIFLNPVYTHPMQQSCQSEEIVINGMKFQKLPNLKYAHDYVRIVKDLESNRYGEEYRDVDFFRSLIKEDLWFIVYFVLKVSCANHPFWIQSCKEVEQGASSHTLDLWARGHGKTTILSIASTIQRILKNPEERIGIFSYAAKPALSIFQSVKQCFEQSQFLKDCFADILYENPHRDAYKWGDEMGLYVKRESMAREPTLSAWGLIEGMPTGYHFTGRIYDDIMTEDLMGNPEIMYKVKEMFDLSQNLSSDGGWHIVTGTPYHHEDVLAYLKGKRNSEGKPLYTVRLKPATEGGLPNGKSVYKTEEELNELRSNRQKFFCQQLLDPTPIGVRNLDFHNIKLISKLELPEKLHRFMMVDPAGNLATNKRMDRQDSWALAVVGVDPYLDDIGASSIYILDLQIEPMTESEALQAIVDMYCRNGRILKLGVEKVAMTTTEVHVANALKARGRFVSLENGMLTLLRPAGRSKQQRIEQNWQWPLNQGKVHMLDSIPVGYRTRLQMEMDKFPYWHEDGIDCVSYTWDIMKEYRFWKQGNKENVTNIDDYKEARGQRRFTNRGWMAA